jgi:hypothetical protein
MYLSNGWKGWTAPFVVTAFWMGSYFVQMAGASPAAAPIPFVDQQNLVGHYFGGVSAPDFLLGQSFTPSLNGIDSIDLNISILAFPAQMRVALLDGLVGLDGLQAPVIGMTQTVTITETSLREFRFDFPVTVALTPGNPYVMRFEPIGANSNPQIEINTGYPPNPYPGGQALQLHLPPSSLLDRDFVFAEGLNQIPEPSSLLLLAIAVGSGGKVIRPAQRPRRR